MITRIAKLFLLFCAIVPLHAAEESIFETVGSTLIFKENLTQDLSADKIKTLLASVETELGAQNLTALKKDELWMAKGLLQLQQKNWKGVVETLDQIAP